LDKLFDKMEEQMQRVDSLISSFEKKKT
jgi:hypothetical protein